MRPCSLAVHRCLNGLRSRVYLILARVQFGSDRCCPPARALGEVILDRQVRPSKAGPGFEPVAQGDFHARPRGLKVALQSLITTFTGTGRGFKRDFQSPRPRWLPGVQRADVSFRDKEARVTFDPARVTSDQRIQAVDQLGFHASLKAGG